jgi:pimeloyl-ACP methyl ester carboxylesterase
VNRKRLLGAAIGTAGAVGVGAAVAARRYAVGRARWRIDPDADEPFGELRGRPLTVETDDGVPLHVEVEGPEDAPVTVVFCHGYCLNQDSWHYQRRDLDHGIRTVFWDQRGHGRSGRGDIAHATIEQCGEDLLAVLRATAVGPVVLVGHSMGGMTIMALAERHPELFGEVSSPTSLSRPIFPDQPRIAGIALINTSPGELAELTFGLPPVLGTVMKRALPGMVSGLGRRPELVDRGRRVGADVAFILTRRIAFADREVSPTVVDFLERMIRSTPIDVIADFYPTFAEHDKLAALDVLRKVPALVVVGARDRITPPAHGRAIAAALPDAELLEIADGGHVVILEHPGVITEALAELIDRALPLAGERSA